MNAKLSRSRLMWSMAAVLCLVLVLPAWGDYLPDDNISIGNAEYPVVIPLEPGAPPWDKVINDPSGEAWADDWYDLQHGQDVNLLTVIAIQEYLVVGGVRSWTDWHEELVNSPGWVWDQGQFGVPGVSGPFMEVRSPGGTDFNPPDGLEIMATDTTVDFFFDPLEPGTEVRIIKRLIFLGADRMFNTEPGDWYQGPLTIREYPTPEPAGLLMMALGGLLLYRRRRAWH